MTLPIPRTVPRAARVLEFTLQRVDQPSAVSGTLERELQHSDAPRKRLPALVMTVIGCLALPLWAFAADASAPASAPSSAEATAAEVKPELRPWIAGLAEGRRRALADRKPILLRATAEWCPPCRVLEEQLGKDEVQAALADWTLVEVDVDRAPDDARQLGVTAVPTLRILTAAGRPIAEHLGLLDAEGLVAWLAEHRQAAREAPDDALLAAGKPNLMAAVKLAAAFGHRDPAVRHAAIGRLRPHPDVGAAVAVQAFGEGSLAERLTALELLDAWGAPVEEVDPWKPETIDADLLARLDAWLDEAAGAAAAPPEPPAELSHEQRAVAGEEIDRMLRGTDAEAAAARDRLARFGPGLAEEVDRRLAEAATDRDRERLAALRLRLAASDTLALRWPGGIERLAATDSAIRRQAAEQLAALATAADQALLLRLFADPDPLVREIGLQGLQRVGGPEALGTLAELLSDPEPNVRAAVLKLLEENPLPSMVPQVAEYVETETDPDLLVHALRFLRASGGAAATRAMMGLVDHPSWQVRAEAAAGLGNVETSFRRYGGGSFPFSAAGTSDAMQAESYAALIRLLDDPDAFVVSRAVEGLAGADLAIAVEPLVKAAAAHPELAASIVAMLARGEQMRPKAVPHLRRFARHEDAVIRAAAVTGLVQAVPHAAEEELAAGVDDSDSEVRTAAAVALMALLEETRHDAARRIERQQQEAGALAFIDPFEMPTTSPSLLGRLGGALGRMFGGGTPQPAVEAEVVPEPGEPPVTLLPDGDAPVDADPPVLGPADSEPVPMPPGQTPNADPDDDAEPDAPAADLPDPGVEWDRWLEEYYAGKRRPAFAAKMVEPLRKMLSAEAPRERLAAALVLVPLGLADEALPVVLDTARDEPALRGDAAAVLPWLVWQRRREAFEQFYALVDDDAWNLMQNLLPVADRRAAELLWSLPADAEKGGSLVGVVYRQLETIYLGSSFYGSAGDIAPAIRAEALRAARPRVGEGSDWQRAVALALVLRVAPAEAAALAEPLADDPSAPELLRNMAFQVLLAAQSGPERHAAAIAALGSDSAFRKSLAVAYLAEGSNQLAHFQFGGSGWHNWLDLAVVDDGAPDDPFGHFGAQQSDAPELPPDLKPEHLRPLLDQGDPALAAQAGYLLVLLGDASGLEPLLRQWRALDTPAEELALPRDPDSLRRLVYRAIAALDDSSRIDVLREIYGTLDEYEVRDFYWTIRVMTGPEMLQFRKEIRDEVGMEQLR